MKKANEITEDDVRNAEKHIQNLTDKFCAKIDEMCSLKVKEVMSL
jgi:ribosome recycling factor